MIKKVLNDFGCKKNFPVADIGAGTGKLTKQLLKQNLIVSAVEPNLNMRKFGISIRPKYSIGLKNHTFTDSTTAPSKKEISNN